MRISKRIKILLHLTFILIVTSIRVLGQNAESTETKDSTNIYYQAFSIYCNQLSFHDSTKQLLVEDNSITTASIPKKIGVYNIQLLEYDGILRELKGKSAISLIRIIPMRFENGFFFINIIPFGVSKVKNGLNYSNGGGCSVEFTYNCATNKFKFVRIKCVGI